MENNQEEVEERKVNINNSEEEKSKKRFIFPKEERLHHRSLVEGLFRKGHTLFEFPFRVSYRIMTPEDLISNFRNSEPEGIGKLQMLVTVPKKKRKRAVDRVLMRRRIREAYRLNRLSLRESIENQQEIRTLSVGLIYIHDKNLDYRFIEEKIKNIMKKLTAAIAKEKNN